MIQYGLNCHHLGLKFWVAVYGRTQEVRLIRKQTRGVNNSPQINCMSHYRNVRGLGKSMVVFSLFEKLRYSNERSTMF